MQELLAGAHGNDIDLLDAYTGALAETEDESALFAGPLLRVGGRKEGTDRGGMPRSTQARPAATYKFVDRRTAAVFVGKTNQFAQMGYFLDI